MTTTVFDTGALPGGIVTALCLLPSTSSTGARSTVLAPISTTVDPSGRWALELVPNSQVKPTGTFWEITEPTVAGDPNIWQVIVPAGATPSTIASFQVTRLTTATSSGITAKPTVTGSRGSATTTVLTNLLTALASAGVIVNNTTP